MHQGGADHGAVDHAPGNHDVRTLAQGFDDAGSAQVGIGRDAHRWQGRAAEHFLHAAGCQLLELRLQVIAQQHGDFQGHTGRIACALQRGGAGQWIDPAGVTDHADALLADAAQERTEHLDEVGGVTGLGIFQAGTGQQRHGDLRQIVEHQVVQPGAFDQLRSGGRGVAPKGTGTADTNGFVHCEPPTEVV
ncbi:hypothetical protein D3C84_477520 [compost metagenome]